MTIALSLFIFSIVGIVALILLKYREANTELVLFKGFRTNANASVERAVAVFHRNISKVDKNVFMAIIRSIAYYLGIIALKSVQFIEKRLIRFINFIKGKGTINKNGSASFYLKSISEHKKNLDRK